MKEFVFLEFLCANVTSCSNELTGDLTKVTSILKHWCCLLTRCLTSPRWRTVCFKSTFTTFTFCPFSADGLLKVKTECAATR